MALSRLADGRTPPVLDGRLDDEAWSDAPLLGPLTQVVPVEGAAPSERTEVRIVYDRDFLYFGIRCLDDQPDQLIAKAMRRDASLRSDDRVSLVIDTFRDRRNGFLFSTNPNGARFDGLIEDNTRFRARWNGIWYAKSRVDDRGWTTEIAIPFQTLSYDPAGNAWGFNILRTVRRRNEEDRWTAARQNVSLIDLSQAGVLSGIRGIQQGLGLDLVPRGIVTGFKDREAGRSFTRLTPSFDGSYKITPSVTGVLTVNTDFSDAAADARQINLSRFSLFFPETRKFFLQDAGIFDFGPFGNSRPNGLPFFSRRIGIDEDGAPVDLDVGAKVTGRLGPLNFGILDTQMDSSGAVDARNLLVARGKWNLLRESRVGFIVTHGDPNSNASNTVWGTDLRLRSNRILGDQILQLDAWFERSHSSAGVGSDNAYGLQLAYPNDRWQGELAFQRIGDRFHPALGFVNRDAIREFRASGRRRWRPEGSWLRSVDVGLRGRLVTDLSGHLETRVLEGTVIQLRDQLDDFVRLRVRNRREQLSEEFEISDGVVLPPDRYDMTRGILSMGTAISRPVSLSTTLTAGSFFSGRIWGAEGRIELRPSKYFFTSFEYSQNRVRLDEGSFTTRLARLRINFAFSPDLSWDTFAQWDNDSDSLGWNSRLLWIVQEGNELALVWNQGVDTSATNFRFTRSELVGRISWTFRF